VPRSRPSSAPTARRKPRPVSRAELARLTGRARSSITEAAGGVLKAACCGAGRIDASHPAVLKYAGVRSYKELLSGAAAVQRSRPVAAGAPTLVLRETAATPTLEAFAAGHGLSVDEIERDFADAVVPAHHLAASTFAMLADCPVTDVVHAVAGELAPAVTDAGRLDATSPAALAWLARRPFAVGDDGELATEDFPLGPACRGDLIDANHWLTAIFLARCGAEVAA
jgi:hypothetical protein